MKKPKQPKLKSLPNKPKASASEKVWDNWDKRADKIRKENDEKIRAYNKEMGQYEAAQKKIDKLRGKEKHTVKIK